MKDISHTPPYGDGTNAVWERGNEVPAPEPTAENKESESAEHTEESDVVAAASGD